MADRPLIDLWKWLGYEDKEKDRESARRVNESTETYKKQREIDTTAALARDKASYETKRQRFLDAHINANRDNPGAVGLAESANRDWAKAVASDTMPNVLGYEETTAKIPGAGKSAKEKQRAETGKSTVEANRAEGQAELSSKAGEDATKAEIAKNAATTATDTNTLAEETAKLPFKPRIGSDKAAKEGEEIAFQRDNMEAAARINKALAPGAPEFEIGIRDLTRQAKQNEVNRGSSLAGIAAGEFNQQNALSQEMLDAQRAELAGRRAVGEELSRSPDKKFANYNPILSGFLGGMYGNQTGYGLSGQPLGDTTAIRPPLKPNPTPNAGIQWR